MRQSVAWLWVLLLWLACGGSGAVAGEAEWKADMQAGQAAYNKGDYRSATPRFEAALKEAEAAFGREHLNTASSLAWLGFLYEAQGRYADAEPLYRRSLAIREKALGPEHPDVATSLNNLGGLYKAQGRAVDALTASRRSSAILARRFVEGARSEGEGRVSEQRRFARYFEFNIALLAEASTRDPKAADTLAAEAFDLAQYARARIWRRDWRCRR